MITHNKTILKRHPGLDPGSRASIVNVDSSSLAGMTSAQGFTLIELLVAIGIFAVMLIIISSVFTRFVQTERQQIGEQGLQEDIRLAMELFNKEARTGYGDTYSGSGDSVTFLNQSGTCVRYRLFNKQMERSGCAGENPEALTDPSTVIDSLKFTTYASGDHNGKQTQGYITIALTAHASDKQGTTLNIQSSVTSRQFKPFQTP